MAGPGAGRTHSPSSLRRPRRRARRRRAAAARLRIAAPRRAARPRTAPCRPGGRTRPTGPTRRRPGRTPPRRPTAPTGCRGPASGRVPPGHPRVGGVPEDEDEAPTVVGVGPWPGAVVDWPTDPRLDRELLRDGDRRNVVDRYRYWRREAVVADLDARRHDFHAAVENWQHDFNIGSIVRTANAFQAKEVHIVGRRRWNRRGAMVTDRYQHVR